jgi:tetratricopeptide (TPR) repeat protein
MLRASLSFLIFHFSFLIATAQQTQIFIDREAAYKNGIELFDEKNYLSAREKFEEIYKQPKTATSHTNEVMMQNLEYYIAVCAFETGDKDAEQLLLNYIKKYHETDKRRMVYFYLGKYYFRNNQFNDAITYFLKVDINDLSNEQIYEYKFQLAYAYFTKKKFTEAKPLFASIKDIQGKYFYPATYYYGFICFYTKDYNEALKSFEKIEDSKMYASVIPYYIAQIYYFKKDYDKVVSYVKKSLDRPDVMYKSEMKFLLGQVYFQKSEYAKALPLLEEYISKSSKSRKEDIYQLAYCYYQTGAYEKAIENFKQLNVLDEPIGQNATYAMADCYLKLNLKDKARSAFQSASGKSFDEAIKQQALFNYAKLSFELGYSTEAIQGFENYINGYPEGTHIDEANELLAGALVQTKNYERAYKIMEGMKMESALIKEAYQKVTYFRAVELFNDKKTDEALVLCDKSLMRVVNIELQALALYLKAEILYGKEKYDDASQHYQRFAQYATPSLEKKGEASKFRAFYNTGYCSFKKKNYADAALYFDNAIEESQTTVDAKGKASLLPDLYLRYADCAFITKNYGKSLDAYNKIVAMKWANADYAQFQKGIVLGLQAKDDEKIEAMNQLVAKFPGSVYAEQANFELGETYLAVNNLTAARKAYETIIQRNANSSLLPKAYVKIGVIDYNSGKKEQAIEDYKGVVKKFPDSQEAKESLDALKDIYVELGRVDEFFDFAKGNGNIVIATSEQDSLTFQSADNAYIANDCSRAINLYGNYLTKFPNGFFANEAHWKKADCHIKAKEFAKAFADFEPIIANKYSKYYEKAVLKASGIAYYELSDYAKANSLYKQLYVSSTSAQNSYTAMIGLLRTAVKLNNTTETIEYADQFINSGAAKDADLQEAIYEKAKAYYSKGDKEFALGAFNRVTEMPVSEKAVEAKYMVAKILFEQQNYKNSLDTCFKLKNKYSSYEYWVAKTFVLVADNYYAQGNVFQAKATLESIVENYEGDKALLDEAKTKLEKMKTEELNKSKIIQTTPGDTLIMEQDNSINR